MMRFERNRKQSEGRRWMRARTMLATAAVLALSACAFDSNSNSGDPPAAPPAAGTISICNRTESGCASASAYSLSTLRDLSVTVNWSHVSEGTHTQTLEFLDPKGGLFDVRNVAFAVSSADGSAQTNVILPIAGTFLTQRSTTGQWSVRVSLDGQSAQVQNVDLQP